MTAPEQIRFQAGSLNFAAFTWGPADGPLALCLHGYPDTAWTWRHLGPRLAEGGWRVVAPFMRGYAPTDLAPDGRYQVGALARDAIESHRVLGGDRRAVLIGHDWGAIAAYCAGSAAPGTFKRVVTLAVPPLGTVFEPLLSPRKLIGDLPLVGRQLRCSWYTLFQQLPMISEAMLDKVIPRLWAEWSPGYQADEDLAHVWEALPDPAHRTAALRYYRALAQPWYRSKSYAREQSHLMRVPDVPVLFMQGVNDGCLRAEFAQRAGAGLPPGSEVEVVADAGHFLQLERPEIVNDRVAAFVAGA